MFCAGVTTSPSTSTSETHQNLQSWLGGDGGRNHERQPVQVQVSRGWASRHGHQPLWTQDPSANGQSSHHYRGTASRWLSNSYSYISVQFQAKFGTEIHKCTWWWRVVPAAVCWCDHWLQWKSIDSQRQLKQQCLCVPAPPLSFSFLKASEVGPSCQRRGDTSDWREGGDRERERAGGQTQGVGGKRHHLSIPHSK